MSAVSALVFAVRRILARPALSALIVLGGTLVVALPTAIPSYAAASTARVLADQELADSTGRPPLAYLFSYSGDRNGPSTWSQLASLDAYLQTDGPQSVGVDLTHRTTSISTRRFTVVAPAPAPGATAVAEPIALTWLEDLEARVELIDGRLPDDAAGPDAVEVAVSDVLADERGLDVGDSVTLADPQAASAGEGRTITATITGVWTTGDRGDRRWVLAPEIFEQRLLTTRATIVDTLDPAFPTVIGTTYWYALLDDSGLTVDAVDGLIASTGDVEAEVADRLATADVAVSPRPGLLEFRSRARELRQALAAFAVPGIVLVGIFLGLIVALSARDQRRELAMLRSRGTSRGRLIGHVLAEGIVLAGTSFVLGLGAALAVAASLGRVTSFLRLDGPAALTVRPDTTTWAVAAIAAVAVVVARVVPAIGASRRTVVDLDGPEAPPWWQRGSVDLVLAAVALVLVVQLVRQRSPTSEPLDDPTTVWLPSLAALAIGLLCTRLLPRLFLAVAAALRAVPGVVPVLVARRLGRQPESAHAPLVLLVSTVVLAVFTTSLATSMDRHLADREYHAIGADWQVFEAGAAQSPFLLAADGRRQGRLVTALDPNSYETLDGIDEATRVGDYSAFFGSSFRVLAVEPDGFGRVAFYRPDYGADESFATALARLAATPDGVLASESAGLDVGTRLAGTVAVGGGVGTDLPVELVVVGTFADAPTLEPDQPAVIARLDHLSQLAGAVPPYRLWLRQERGTTTAEVGAALEAQPLVVTATTPATGIAAERRAPERQGVFGVLTVGFLTSIAVAMIGFFVTAFFAARRSAPELGALQAIGASPRQAAAVVVGELAVVAGLAVTIGVGAGLALSAWMVPELLGGGDVEPAVIPDSDLRATLVLVGAIVAAVVATAVALALALGRVRLFEALRLGDIR
ncbi:MAG: ABC transporter permease [Actinomycetota bacterium]